MSFGPTNAAFVFGRGGDTPLGGSGEIGSAGSGYGSGGSGGAGIGANAAGAGGTNGIVLVTEYISA